MIISRDLETICKMAWPITELAILGGTAKFPEPLHVGRPNVGDRERLFELIGAALDRRWLTNNGPLVRELEQRIADYLRVRHCIAMCNGTVALEILFRAVGCSGEVIVPAFTFVATAHALRWLELNPIFCDIEPRTHNLDPRRVEQLITPDTSAILGVHLWGRPCDVDALQEISDRRGIPLLFDAAHAFASSSGGQMIGNFGLAEAFSFHATKFFNTFEGGAVVTNDDELADTVRHMRNFGYDPEGVIMSVGTNGKMSEISAAMGLTSLEAVEAIIDWNYRNYCTYIQELRGIPGIQLARYDENEKSNYQYIIIEVDSESAGITRDLLVDVLRAENILAKNYFHPGVHRLEPYRSELAGTGAPLRHTEALASRVLALPTGTAVGADDIRRVCGVIRSAVAHGPELTERLPRLVTVTQE